MIQKAQLSDLKTIYSLTKICAQNLIDQGIFQWNEYYPSKEVLHNDIQLQQIWKLEVEHEIVGIIVLTEIEDEEYKNVKWLTKNKRNLYVHRLAVLPKFQKKGYAQKLMNFAEEFACQKEYASIRLDTFSQNERNQHFYEQRGYIKLESIYFAKQSEHPFYCYELVFNV